MKITILMTILLTAVSVTSAFADDYVEGYERSDGTYVQGYHRTTADSTPTNNYSYPGNENPYHHEHKFETQMGSFAPRYGR